MRAVTAFVAVAIPACAHAQGVPANIGVAERARPDYDPIGGRIGSFILYPRIEVAASYDDNIYATPSNTTSDEIIAITPAIRLVSQWQRNSVDLNASYTRNAYLNNDSENSSVIQGNAAGVLDISRQTRVRLQAVAGRFVESRTSFNAVSFTASPTQFTRFGGRLGVDQEFTNFSITAEGGVQKVSFKDSRLPNGANYDQSFRNNTLSDATVRFRYGFRGGASAIAQITADSLHYENELPSGLGFVPFDRDSTGYKAEVGLALELSSLLYGDVRIGYLRRNAADPTIRDVSGLSFGANMLWNVTPLTSVRFIANRTTEDSNSRIVAGNLRSEGTVQVNHELLRNLILDASLRYAVISPIGPIDDSDEVEGRVGATYFINRRFGLTASYRLYKRSSDILNDFTSNRLTLTLVTRF